MAFRPWAVYKGMLLSLGPFNGRVGVGPPGDAPSSERRATVLDVTSARASRQKRKVITRKEVNAGGAEAISRSSLKLAVFPV